MSKKNIISEDNHDTITLIAQDCKGNFAAACSTSGLRYKLNGRVGDSPIIGSGIYVDNEIGAAGATGQGEEIMKNVGSFLIIELMKQGYGTIVLKNPGAKHSLGVGILNKLNLIVEGSLGYFGVGSIDGPVIRISGRVGWSCAENMMAGKVVIEKNAGSCFGAAIRGGDLICKGSVGARTGIDQKGGSIIVGGDAGAFTGFMMQRGRIVILGDVGINLGDSMYDGTIYVGGKIGSFGSDAVEAPMTKNDIDWLNRKLKVAEIGENFDVSKMTKVVAGKKLWNYDALEPTEKKGAI